MEDDYSEIYAQKWNKLQEFAKQNVSLARDARNFTHNLTILAKIADHKDLFSAYIRLDGDRTTDLGRALSRLADDIIVIHFTEIDCYGIYTQRQYHTFCNIYQS